MGSDYHKREKERGESLLVFIGSHAESISSVLKKEQNSSMIGDLKEISNIISFDYI